MSNESELRRMAQEAATRIQTRAGRVHREYLEVQEISRNSTFERDSLARSRVSTFKAKIAADYQYPTCWVEKKTRSPMRQFQARTGRTFLNAD
jgi:hypothetical protein